MDWDYRHRNKFYDLISRGRPEPISDHWDVKQEISPFLLLYRRSPTPETFEAIRQDILMTDWQFRYLIDADDREVSEYAMIARIQRRRQKTFEAFESEVKLGLSQRVGSEPDTASGSSAGDRGRNNRGAIPVPSGGAWE